MTTHCVKSNARMLKRAMPDATRKKILRAIIKRVFYRKGIVLTQEDTRWLIKVADEAWREIGEAMEKEIL